MADCAILWKDLHRNQLAVPLLLLRIHRLRDLTLGSVIHTLDRLGPKTLTRSCTLHKIMCEHNSCATITGTAAEKAVQISMPNASFYGGL